MAIPYSLVQSEDTSVLTTIINGTVYTAEKTHVNWRELIAAVTTADESTDLEALVRLFDPATAVATYFNRVSERVSVAGGRVYFDGEEVNSGLSNHIIRFINENEIERAHALVNFMENVMTNPNEHSREQLFDWLSRYDFAINDAGHFLAYKGVYARSDEDEQYPYESSSSGRAIVDGQVYNGRIPNGVGAVVEMPRGEVQHDPSVGCHTGLHAGTYDYASTFTRGPVLLVEINPRDVVSVPTDCNWAKIRTCRYTVKEVIENELSDSYYDDPEDDESDVDLDEDYSDDAPLEGQDPLATPVFDSSVRPALGFTV